MTDIYTNDKPFGLMGKEMQAALPAHFKAGGGIEYFCGSGWATASQPSWTGYNTYRAVRPAPTPDVIAWKLLPDWVQSVARDADGEVLAYETVDLGLASRGWFPKGRSVYYRRIDDFHGLVQIGTCDWKDSKQTRPEGV